MDARRPEAALTELRALLGERLSTAADERLRHGVDASYHRPHPPDAVAYPASTEEVSALARICAGHGVPMVPFGAGTSLEGHVAALRGGVAIDLTRMNRVVAVNRADLDATVQAGVTRKQLDAHLAAAGTGLFFSVDPGADATLGGMAATRASGTNAVRYGTMRDNVLGLTVVLADGRVIRTGGRARKSAAGYDLTRLFVGSEGTLGVIAELTLRLQPRPEAVSAAVCPFPSLAAAVDTVIATVQAGLPVARVELLDEAQMAAVNRYSGLAYPVAPTLFFEFHGTPGGVVEQAERVQAIAAAHGAAGFQWATAAEERARLWQARHDAYYAALALRPGARGWPTDVCVPISRLAECVLATQADLVGAPFPVTILGHVGDGNFHVVYVLDPDSPDEVAAATRLNERMVARALAMGGTCTGEHGVGYGKMAQLAAEHGPALEVMRALKAALDPRGLLNPGKLFADRVPAEA
jgi:D-lactate dehydrogenase (cytochrome)